MMTASQKNVSQLNRTKTHESIDRSPKVQNNSDVAANCTTLPIQKMSREDAVKEAMLRTG